MEGILIKNGTIVTMGPKEIIDPGAVFVEGSKIVAVGPSEEVTREYGDEAEKVIDARSKVVRPGYLDTHTHICQQFLRGAFGKIARLQLRDAWYPSGWKTTLVGYESGLTEEDVYLSAKAAFASALRSGTTFLCEHGGHYLDVIAQAAEEIGIRVLLSRCTMDSDELPPPLPPNMICSTDEAIRRGMEVVERWPHGGDDLVQGALSLRQIVVCSKELHRLTIKLAEEYQVPINTHANEGRYEVYFAQLAGKGVRPARYLADIGGLSPWVMAAHAVELSEEEVKIYADHEVGIMHCPSGNFAGLGMINFPLLRALYDKRKIGLGSDGAAGGSTDLSREMHLTWVIQTMLRGAPRGDRGVISPKEAINMATIDGAQVVHLDHRIGSLEAGKQADLVIVKPGLDSLPVSDPMFMLTACQSGISTVDAVLVNGQFVMENGELLTIDEEALCQEVAVWGQAIQNRYLDGLERRAD